MRTATRKLIAATAQVTVLLLIPRAALCAPVAGPISTFPGQPNARITAVVDKPTFFLGENVMIRLHIRNVSDKPFTVETHGDDEYNNRQARFHITAVDEMGAKAIDPDPFNDSMGGLSGEPPEVTRSHDFWAAAPLFSYCRIDHPGTYTITVSHDLGWVPGAESYVPDVDSHVGLPTATVTVKFVMPTPSEARRVVAQQRALPDSGGQNLPGYEDAGPPEYEAQVPDSPGGTPRDFSTLRYAVYLPILAENAMNASGQSYAEDVLAISSIPTPAATAELIRLIDAMDPNRAAIAGDGLARRLRNPVRPDGYDALTRMRKSDINYLYSEGWSPSFATGARGAARKLLTYNSALASASGAQILLCVGDRQDLASVTAALDRELALNTVTHLEPDDPGQAHLAAIDNLTDTAVELEKPNHGTAAAPNTPGEMLVWLAAICSKKPVVWPDGWQVIMNRLFATPNHALRAVSLENMGESVADPQVAGVLIPYMPDMLRDDDWNLSTRAVYAAGYIHSFSLNPALLNMLRSMDVGQSGEVVSVLNKNGAEWDALSVLIDRAKASNPGSDNTAQYAENEMFSLLAGRNPSSDFGQLSPSDALAYVSKWRAFIDAHKAEIQVGKRWKADDPEIKELFPSATPPGSKGD